MDIPASSVHVNTTHCNDNSSKSRRIIQIFIALLSCFLTSGIVFGYAALKPVLINEHAYREYCTQEELDENVPVCVGQEIRLNLIFTVAVVATNACALPVGTILDRYGPQICGLISSFLLMIGALLLAFSAEIPFDGYLVGYLFLALGGAFIYLPSLHLSNSFPNHSGTIMALISGAFDSSSAIFLMYHDFYSKSGGTLGPKKFFLAFLIVPLFVFLSQLLYMPKFSYKSDDGKEKWNLAEETSLPGASAHESAASLGEDFEQTPLIASEAVAHSNSEHAREQSMRDESRNSISGIWGVMHGKTTVSQILSSWFILMTIFTISQMTRINYFVATIRPQYEYILGSYEDAIAVNNLFDRALPLGGLIAIPFIGLILDNMSSLSVIASLLTTSTIIGVLGCLSHKWAAYTNVCLFVLYRPFYYTMICDLTGKVFGFQNFGVVYGLMFFISGFFNFTASFLDELRYKSFHKNPIPINIFLIAISMSVGIVFFIFVKTKADGLRRKELQYAAENAPEIPIPSIIVERDSHLPTISTPKKA
ncbi:Protein FMP42 [Golovinomyces cichoracearum]|uniref:Protein FMP42 n=1 Tax=Golovinomyces cichoracearum TaxID=62708 RepID=A0A420HER1_9PEZI|nr:Protein FMP42 [Golovinomyces cichoracearum]